MNKLKYIFLALVSFLPGLASAQEETSKGILEQYQVELVLALAVLVCLVAILAMFTLLVAMRTMLRMKMAEEGVTKEEQSIIKVREGEEGVGFWGRFWNRFNESVPVAKEHSVATDHEYDGIRELDNRLPGWWLYGFYFTIFFGVVYLIHYHVINTGPSQAEEYEIAMQQAEEDVQLYLASLDNLIDESSVTLTTESADINAGKAIYDANCLVCHAADGGGGVGPNFTDKYWIHGGDMPSIFRTIKYGVPEKGMISWESQLSPKKMQQVASYIYLMEGTVAASPKEPQGELFERPSLEEAPSDTTITDTAGS